MQWQLATWSLEGAAKGASLIEPHVSHCEGWQMAKASWLKAHEMIGLAT